MSDTTDPIRRFLSLCLGGATAAQAVAAIVFYFAANWWGMAPAAKVGLIDLLLVLCAAAAAWAPPASFARSTWAVAGAVLSGVLFGVHGQIWQSGADAWELFALWTALAALWAALARSDAVWALTAILGMTALWLWGDHAAPPALLPTPWENSVLAAPPLVVAGLARLAGARSAWLLPVLVALAALALGVGGVMASGQTLWPLAVGLVVAAVVLAGGRPHRFGPWPFAIALVLAVVLVETLLIERLTGGSGMGEVVRLLAVAALLLAGVAMVATGLRRIFSARIEGVLAARLDLALSAAVGVGAWIAAGAALAGVGLFVNLMWGFRHLGGALAVAAALVSVVIRLAWPRPQMFGHHVQAAFAVMAYGAVLAELVLQEIGLDMVAAASVALLVPLALVTRAAAAGAVATATALTLVAMRLYEVAPWAVAVLAVAVAPLGWLGVVRQAPSLRAGAVCLLLGAFVLPAGLEFGGERTVGGARLAAALAGAGLMAATLWTRRELAQPRLMAAGGLVLAASLAVPAGAAGLVGLVSVSARAIGRPLVALGFVAAGWSVVRFYDLLAVPLDRKALLLALGAVVTAAAWGLLAGRPRLGMRPGAASALLLAGALVPAAIEAWDATAKARVVAEGQQVLLPLRPADPRSLIQGDFMALRYDRTLMKVLPESGGLAALRLEDGVAVAARPLDGAPASAEVMVRVRPGRHEARLAPDSFLFQEGTGKAWSRAKYAIVRVHGGDMVLTGLADADRVPIRPEVQ